MNLLLLVTAFILVLESLQAASLKTDSLKAELILRHLTRVLQPHKQLDQILTDLASNQTYVIITK